MTSKSPVSDEILTAYLDGEIPENRQASMAALIAQDEELQQRLEQLQINFGGAIEAYQQIQVPDLSKQIGAIYRAANNQEKSVLWTPARIAFAAGIIGLTFAVGIFADRTYSGLNVPSRTQVAEAKKPGWRQSVANYVSLYTFDTISRAATTPKNLEDNFVLLSNDVDLDLTSENTSVRGLDYKRGQILGLRGKPLVQLAYLYQNKIPVAFCIIKGSKGKKPMQFEVRNGLEIAHWSSESHGFMVIGDMPREDLTRLAKSFSVTF